MDDLTERQKITPEMAGEFVDQLAVVVQNPLASVLKDGVEYKQLENDRTRSQVLDLAANGREAPKLPVREYDMRTWEPSAG